MADETKPPSTSTWCFVAATFMGATPNLFVGELHWAPHVAFTIIAFALLMAGLYQFNKERHRTEHTDT